MTAGAENPSDDLLGRSTGLSPDLVRAYRTLVGRSSLDGAELAEALEVDDECGSRWLAELAAAGYATPIAADEEISGPRFVASPPTVTLGSTVAEQEETARRARQELTTLEEVYRVVSMGETSGDVVQVVRGADAVAEWFARVQAGARSEISAFVQHPVAVTAANENPVEDELVARGVSYRVLLERAMLEEHPGGLDAFAESLAAGEEARVVTTLPLRMIIADRELAYMPMLADRDRASAAALLVRPSTLLTALLALFDSLWLTATPVVLAAESADPGVGVVDDLDARLLSLLLAGMTDEAAARQLGVSLRTVQRRVRDLMDRAGVRTRAQLGWYAARAGWDSA